MVTRFQKSLYVLLACFMALFIASSFFVRAKYIYSVYGDTPVLEGQNIMLFLLLIALVLAVGAGLYRLSLKLNAYSPKIVIPVTLLCSFAIQAAILFAFPRLPTDDSETVLSLALDMLYRNDYSTFQTTGYLHMFPFNFSTVLYLRTLLQLFPDNYLVLKLFNILCMLVTTLMIYRLYRELNQKSKGNDYAVLLFAATYIPALFMSNFIYNDVIATALLTSALYFAVRFFRHFRYRDIIVSAVLLATGNYFRSVGAIFLIAIIVCLLMRIRAAGIRKTLLALGITAVLFNAPGWTQNAVLQASGVVDEPVNANSAPVYMWLNMGINQETFGFWDNRASYSIYQNDADYNKELSTELFKTEIRNTLSESSAASLVKMYYKKLIWTWTEGTYQIDRYGIGNDGSAQGGRGGGFMLDRYSYSTFATDLFAGESVWRTGTLWTAYVLNFLMYCFILFRLIGGIRAGRYGETSLVLVILGFIGFYLLWEIKSRYLYPVYPLLIVFASLGFKDVYHLVFMRKKEGGRQQ